MSYPESKALLELAVGAVGSPILAEEVRARLDRAFTFTRGIVEALVAGSPLADLLPLDLVAQVAASAFFGLTVVELVGGEVDVAGLTDLVDLLTRLGLARP